MSGHRSFLGPLKWAFVMNWGDRAFSFVFVVLLAAILGPHDFGVVMLALIYIEFIRLFLEGGVQTALVQREDLRREHLDSAFWVNLVWCVALAGLSVALSGWWARINDVPELADVVKVLSILLVLQGLTIVQLGLFQREMRFKALADRLACAVVGGGVIGLTLAHTRGHMVRAVLEGVSYAMRDSLAIIQELGVPVRQIRASGGGSTSQLWRQIQADVFGQKVVTLQAEEGPAYGVALLAAVGAGAFKNVEEACKATIRVVKQTAPNKQASKHHDAGFGVYQNLYRALKDEFKHISAIENG